MSSGLYVKVGVMGAGKSLRLIQNAYDYESKGLETFIMKSSIDTRDKGVIKSRFKDAQIPIDYAISKGDDLYEVLKNVPNIDVVKGVFVDEMQFLTKQQAKQLHRASVMLNLPILAYGLKIDYKGEGFEGSNELITLSKGVEEIIGMCKCGRKASMHLLSIDGEYVFEGDSVVIGDTKGEQKYESVCPLCYYATYEYSRIKKKILEG